MLGLEDAEHEESSPEASNLLISHLSCSLVGESEQIKIKADTLVHQLYGQETTEEKYLCNYALNPAYKELFTQGSLQLVGLNDEGAVRIVELEGHRFFVGTLFMPQLSSTPEAPHPLIMAYLEAATSPT